VLILYGGYGRHWGWIGVNGRTATLWDWLQLLLLPIAAVILALWLRHRPRLSGALAVAAGGLTAAFGCVVIAGYLVPWAWTGFVGNTLWDWLNLAALPLVVALIPVVLELRTEWRRRHAVAVSVVAVVFVVVVLAGYLAPWRWTGFVGNTVWDWLHLLLLPLLVPLAIVPVLRAALDERFSAGVASAEAGEEEAKVEAKEEEKEEEKEPEKAEAESGVKPT
jgi:hypothetical protein